MMTAYNVSPPEELPMLNNETQKLIIELLNQEQRKAKFLRLYQKEVQDAKQNFIDHLKTLGVCNESR